MTKAIQLGKRALHVGVAVSTIAWSIGLATFVVPLTARAAVASGDLIKASLPAVYFYGGDGKRYVFPNEKTYKTWYSDFSTVKTVTDSELAAISIGGNVTYRPGVKMVKITTDPKVYAVAKGGVLKHVASEAVAVALYGADWNKQIDDVPDAFFTNYSVGSAVNAAAEFDKAAEMASATTINADKGLAETGGGGVSGGGALQVSAASDNPTGGSILADSDNDTTANDHRSTMLKVRFVSTGAAAKVTQLKFRRAGVAADSDVDAMNLFDGDTFLTQNTSLSSGVGTFLSSVGLFTVPAGGEKVVTLKIDIDNNTTSGKTLGWTLAAADVTSDASSVSGSVSGNLFTVASVTDVGYVEVANVTPGAATTVDPQDNYELWRFKLDANDQNMLIKRLTLTNVGSVDSDDLQNMKLMDGGTQLGATVALATGGKVSFDLTSMADGGLKMLSGTTKQLSLRGDIKGGTNRTYRWSLQNTYEAVVQDLNYNVETTVSGDGAAFSVIQAGGATTINTGNLTIQIASDSPSSNVPDGATSVTLAKWQLSAAGEDVQVDSLDISCGSGDGTTVLANVKLVYGGSQVGTTMSTLTCSNSSPSGTDFSFGNTFTVSMGTSKDLLFNADLTNAAVTSGDTIVANLVGGSSNAKGKVSLTAISTSAVSGRTVTVASGVLAVAKNAALADYSSSRPLGVSGLTGVRIGSFVITGGAETSTVSGITMKDDVATSSDTVTLADYFINLKLKHGTTQLGSTTGTLTDTDSTTYEFSLNPSVSIGVGETYVVDVYADIKSSPGTLSTLNNDSTNAGAAILVDKVTATGVVTSSDNSYSTDVALQRLNIATNGMLRVTASADTPTDAQLVLGSTDQVLAKFKLAEESNAEDVLVTKFVVADALTTNTASPYNASGTLRNLKLFKGTELLGTIAALDSVTNNTTVPLAVFDLSGLAGGGLLVGKGTADTVLTVKADLTPWSEGGTASTTHKLFLLGGNTNTAGATKSASCDVGDLNSGNTLSEDWDCTTTGIQNAVIATGKGSGMSISSTNASGTSGLVVGATSGAVGTHANGNVFDAVRAKLTVAHATDAPKGLQTKSSEATVAKFVFSNTSPGGYTATLKLLNLDVNSAGISLPGSGTLPVYRIYKDSIDAVNQLATTTSGTNQTFPDTQMAAGDFTDVEIAAGSSRTIIVTLDTSNSDIGANDTLSVGIQTAATGGQPALVWSDGALPGNLGTAAGYTEMNGLPLQGNTLSY